MVMFFRLPDDSGFSGGQPGGRPRRHCALDLSVFLEIYFDQRQAVSRFFN
jgi:hypothetical protein